MCRSLISTYFICVAVCLLFSCNKPVKQEANLPEADSTAIKARQAFLDSIYAPADTLIKYDKYPQARDTITHTIKQLELRQDWLGVIKGMRRFGYTLAYDRNYDSAIIILNKSFELWEKFHEDSLELCNILNLKGMCYNGLFLPDMALANYKKSLDIIKTRFCDNYELLIHSYNEIGDVYRWGLHDYLSAEKYYYRALKIIEERNRSKDFEVLFHQYYNLASLNRLKNDLTSALSYGHQALFLSDSCRNGDVYKALIKIVLGNIYSGLNQTKIAEGYYEEANDILLEMGSVYSRYIVSAMLNISVLYEKKKDYHMAIDKLKQALVFCKKQKIENTIEVATIYDQLSNLHKFLGDYDLAMSYILRSIKLRKTYFGDFNRKMFYSYMLAGDINKYNNYYDLAIKYYNLSLKQFINDIDTINRSTISKINLNKCDFQVLRPLVKLSEVMLFKYENEDGNVAILEDALSCFYLIDSIYTKIANMHVLEDSKLFLASNYKSVYQNAIICAEHLYKCKYDQSYLNDIHFFIEKSKYRILFNQLMAADLNHQLNVPDSLIQSERELHFNINYYLNKLNDKAQSQKYVNIYRRRAFENIRSLENTKQLLIERYPNYYHLKYFTYVPNIGELRKLCKKNNYTILQYFLNNEYCSILAISADTAKVMNVVMNDSIKNNLSRYLELVNDEVSIKEISTNYREFCAKSN
ncbi:MAG: tetratricopeptide repeat protein, partial [Bacteroidales bacterium]|nr:tetratricopeptide repeat protein [Bacteroidales bacterium]